MNTKQIEAITKIADIFDKLDLTPYEAQEVLFHSNNILIMIINHHNKFNIQKEYR